MVKSQDPRHLSRIALMQKLFSYSFKSTPSKESQLELPMGKHIERIDKLIEKCAPQFPVVNIAKVDVAILRLALYELFYVKSEPAKVIINEAIELAKEFGGEGSPAFVNGVLGTLYKSHFQ